MCVHMYVRTYVRTHASGLGIVNFKCAPSWLHQILPVRIHCQVLLVPCTIGSPLDSSVGYQEVDFFKTQPSSGTQSSLQPNFEAAFNTSSGQTSTPGQNSSFDVLEPVAVSPYASKPHQLGKPEKGQSLGKDVNEGLSTTVKGLCELTVEAYTYIHTYISTYVHTFVHPYIPYVRIYHIYTYVRAYVPTYIRT